MTDRYVVTELLGVRTLGGGSRGRPGLSVHVIDTMDNRRIMASRRSEDHNNQHSKVREWAADRCAELNARWQAANASTGAGHPGASAE